MEGWREAGRGGESTPHDTPLPASEHELVPGVPRARTCVGPIPDSTLTAPPPASSHPQLSTTEPAPRCMPLPHQAPHPTPLPHDYCPGDGRTNLLGGLLRRVYGKVGKKGRGEGVRRRVKGGSGGEGVVGVGDGAADGKV